MSRPSEFWTERKTERLIKLIEHNTVQQVAVIMGISHSTLSAKIKRLRAQGILDESSGSRHSQNAMAAKWTAEEVERLTQLYVREGESTPRIAKILNKSLSSVQCKVARMHLKREKKCINISVREQARQNACSHCDGCIRKTFCYEKWGNKAYLVGNRC